MTLDDVVTMLLAEAIRTRTVADPREWPLDAWIGFYEADCDARYRALRAGWVYR